MESEEENVGILQLALEKEGRQQIKSENFWT